MTVVEMPTERRPRENRIVRFRFTVDQYHRMIAEGILPEGEPIELLNGQLVRKNRSAMGEDPMTVSTRHATTVTKIGDLNPKFKQLGCHLRIQQPVTLPPYHEPEPDVALVTGAIADYANRHPGAKDILCAIEVADSSLQQDRTRKQQIYADSGIPMYVLVNLIEKAVEVYTQPLAGNGRYGRVETLLKSQTLAFPTPTGKGLSVPIRRLLP
jgi:Uma2 family endonuclease